MRTDRVRAIIIIIEILPIEQQIVKLKNASNNKYIDEEEIKYIKDYLKINTKENESIEKQTKNGKLKNAETLEDLYAYVTDEVNARKNKEAEVIEVESISQEENFDTILDELNADAQNTEILAEEDYTLEQAKDVKMKLIRLMGRVTELQNKVYLLHAEDGTTVTSKMARSSETLRTINEKIQKMNWYINNKTPKVEEIEEKEKLTVWGKVKKFFGKIKRGLTKEEKLTLPTENTRKEKRRLEGLQNRANQIIQSESRDIERWANDVFLWQNGFTEQERIDKIYRSICGKGYLYEALDCSEEEKYEVIKIVYSEIERKHQEWIGSARNPINMGQCVTILECDKRKPEGR